MAEDPYANLDNANEMLGKVEEITAALQAQQEISTLLFDITQIFISTKNLDHFHLNISFSNIIRSRKWKS